MIQQSHCGASIQRKSQFKKIHATQYSGFPTGSVRKKSACQCRRCVFNPWVGKIPQRKKWEPIPVFLPGESHGQRNLVGYSPWGHRRVRHNLATNNNNPDIHCSTIYKTKTWKQCKYPLTEEWINKFWYTYTMKKESKIMTSAATWMGLEIIILSEVSQRQKLYDITLYVESKKMIQMNLFIKQKQNHRLR